MVKNQKYKRVEHYLCEGCWNIYPVKSNAQNCEIYCTLHDEPRESIVKKSIGITLEIIINDKRRMKQLTK